LIGCAFLRASSFHRYDMAERADSSTQSESCLQGILTRKRSQFETYGSIEDPKEPIPSWDQYGWTVTIFINAGKDFAKQFAALMVIVMQVFYSYKYLMSCDTRQIGFLAGCACEYTKAYVRCFPLLAILASIFVTSRNVLQTRIFYVFLKRRSLVLFDKFIPLKDPFFLILVWCMSQAFLHFLLDVFRAYSITLNPKQLKKNVGTMQSDEFMSAVTSVAIFYMMPSVFFLIFLYNSYDVEEYLMPFSRYFDDDAESAQKAIADFKFIDEKSLAAFVSADETVESRGAEKSEAMYDQIILKASRGNMKHAASLTPVRIHGEGLTVWRLITTSWPAKLLLNPRLQDEDSKCFKKMWYTSAFLCIIVFFVTFFFQGLFVRKKILDIAEGQTEDICGLVVGLGFTFLNGILTVYFIKEVWVPAHQASA